MNFVSKKLFCLLLRLSMLFSSIFNIWSVEFEQLEIYSSLAWNIPKSVFQKQDLSLSTLKFTYGSRLLVNPFDLRYYQSLQTPATSVFTPASSILTPSSSVSTPAWSVLIDGTRLKSPSSKIPFALSFGTLDYSQTISRLKNPQFYSYPSPFSGFPAFNSGLGVVQAQKSASTRPVSFAASYKASGQTVQAAVTENSDLKLAAGFQFQPGDFFKVSMSAGFTTFDLCSKPSTAWKNPEPQFSEAKYCGLYAESVFSVPFFQAKIAGGAFSNPFDTARFFVSLESLFHYSGFSLALSSYSSDYSFLKSPAPFYTASGDISKTIRQLKLNPQLTIRPDRYSTFRLGASAILDYSFKEFSYNRNSLQKLNFQAGFSGNFPKDYFNIYYKAQNLVLQEFSGEDCSAHSLFELKTVPSDQKITHTIGAKYTKKFDSLNMSVSAQESFTKDFSAPVTDHTETLSLYLYPKRFPITQASLQASVEHKKTGVTPKFTLGMTTSFLLNKLKFTGKFQVCSALLVEQ